MTDRRGFTLVEMLVVILIIGILMSILLSVFGAIAANAKRKETHARISELVIACRNYFDDTGRYPHPSSDLHGNESAVYQLKVHGPNAPYFDVGTIGNNDIYPNPAENPTETRLYVMDAWGKSEWASTSPTIASDSDAKAVAVIQYFRRPPDTDQVVVNGTANDIPFVGNRYHAVTNLQTLLDAWKGGNVNFWSYGPDRQNDSNDENVANTGNPFETYNIGGDDDVGDDLVSWKSKE